MARPLCHAQNRQMEPETLSTPRLYLRAPGPRDAPAVLAACQDPLIQRWTSVPSPYLPEHAETFLHHQVPDGWRHGTMFTFGAFLRAAGTTDGRERCAGVVSTGAHGTGRGGDRALREHNSDTPPKEQGRSQVLEETPRKRAPWRRMRAARGGGPPGHAGGPPPAPGDEAGASDKEGTHEALATPTDGGPLVAVVSVTRRGAGTGEIGFWTAPEHRGRGYATEASRAVIRWAMTRAEIDRVEWRAEVGNTSSRAVADRIGFTMEGVLRSAVVLDGVRRDCWLGAILPSDLGLAGTLGYLPASDRWT